MKKINFSAYKEQVKDIALQMIPVTLGVFLGIIAGDYNQSRNHIKQQKLFLENISYELKANSKKLEKAYQYHASLGLNIDSLMANIDEDELSKPFLSELDFSVLPGWYGINIPTLENSVFESGIISNSLSDLDFKTINQIAMIYNSLKEYKEITKSLANRFINVNSQTSFREIILMVQILTTDIKEMEKNMALSSQKVATYLENSF